MLKETKQKEKEIKTKRRKRGDKQQGITLVALVLTIIIIIILATVAINFIFGENGLITRAQQAKLQQEIETARETLTMVLGDAFVEKKINPGYDKNGFLDDFIKEREPNVYLEEKAIGLDGHVFGLDRSVPELGEYQGELEGPRIQEIKVTNETTNSASIEVIALNAENATYEYWYKNDAEGEEQWKKVETDNKSNTCTIEGLTQGEIYNIRVIITTEEGSTTGEQNVYLGEIPEGTITLTPAEWVGDGTAKTTINTTAEGFALQYQIVVGEGQIDNEAWKPATPGQTIDGLHHNETVYGRLWDGTNESKVYATTTVKDEEGPEINVSTSNITTNGATLEVTASDGESGLAETNTYQYYVDEETTARETSTNNSYNYTGLTQGIEHTLKVIVTDRAGNTTEKTTTITTTNLPGGQEAVEQGIITFTNPTWASGKASVTISTNTSHTMQYQVVAGSGAIVEENWQAVPEGGVIGNLNHNDTVYARLTDGNNYGEDASTTVKDELPPQTATIQLSSTSVTTGTSVTATVTHRDNESGPNISACKYVWNTSSTKIGTDASKYTGGTFSSNGQQISRTMSSKGTYYLHVLTVDKAGNATEKVSSGVTVNNPIPTVESKLKAGDWVRYPSAQGNIDCRVLYDSSSSYGIEIIAMESVEDVTLGNSTSFTASMNSYNNAISKLNSAASDYNNSTYSSRARCVGSNPTNPTSDNTGYFSSSFSYMEEYNGQFKNEDNNYEIDWNQMQALDLHNINDYYWLASRNVPSDGKDTTFNILYCESSGGWDWGRLNFVGSDGGHASGSHTYGLRPVFKLNSNIKVTGGTGEEGSPYTLGT